MSGIRSPKRPTTEAGQATKVGKVRSCLLARAALFRALEGCFWAGDGTHFNGPFFGGRSVFAALRIFSDASSRL